MNYLPFEIFEHFWRLEEVAVSSSPLGNSIKLQIKKVGITHLLKFFYLQKKAPKSELFGHKSGGLFEFCIISLKFSPLQFSPT